MEEKGNYTALSSHITPTITTQEHKSALQERTDKLEKWTETALINELLFRWGQPVGYMQVIRDLLKRRLANLPS